MGTRDTKNGPSRWRTNKLDVPAPPRRADDLLSTNPPSIVPASMTIDLRFTGNYSLEASVRLAATAIFADNLYNGPTGGCPTLLWC